MKVIIWKENYNLKIFGEPLLIELRLCVADPQKFSLNFMISALGRSYEGEVPVSGNGEREIAFLNTKMKFVITDWILSLDAINFILEVQFFIKDHWHTILKANPHGNLPMEEYDSKAKDFISDCENKTIKLIKPTKGVDMGGIVEAIKKCFQNGDARPEFVVGTHLYRIEWLKEYPPWSGDPKHNIKIYMDNVWSCHEDYIYMTGLHLNSKIRKIVSIKTMERWDNYNEIDTAFYNNYEGSSLSNLTIDNIRPTFDQGRDNRVEALRIIVLLTAYVKFHNTHGW